MANGVKRASSLLKIGPTPAWCSAGVGPIFRRLLAPRFCPRILIWPVGEQDQRSFFGSRMLRWLSDQVLSTPEEIQQYKKYQRQNGDFMEEQRISIDGRARWLALLDLCFGSLMIVLDTTIVNVALPSIRVDLGFSETSLAWVVNAYILTFGGFLLLGGRLGDLFGHRRLFLIWITL